MNQLAQINIGETFGSPLQSVDQTGSMISRILAFAFIVAGLSMLLLLIFGAFGIITSAGDAKKAESGKAAATNAVLGFLLIFASYWIIKIVETVTGLNILN